MFEVFESLQALRGMLLFCVSLPGRASEGRSQQLQGWTNISDVSHWLMASPLLCGRVWDQALRTRSHCDEAQAGFSHHVLHLLSLGPVQADWAQGKAVTCC